MGRHQTQRFRSAGSSLIGDNMTNDIKSIPAVGDMVTNVVTHKTPGDPWSITTLTFASGRSVTVSTHDDTIPKYPQVDPSRFFADPWAATGLLRPEPEPPPHLNDRGIVDKHTVTWGDRGPIADPWGQTVDPSPMIRADLVRVCRQIMADTASTILTHANGKPIPVIDRTNGRNDVVGVADNVRTDADGNVICDVHIKPPVVPYVAALQRLFDMRAAFPRTVVEPNDDEPQPIIVEDKP